MIVGVILILTGAVALFVQAGVVDSTIWSLYWPVIMIGVGLSLVYRSEDNSCMMCQVMGGCESEEKKSATITAEKKAPAAEKKVIKIAKGKIIKSKK